MKIYHILTHTMEPLYPHLKNNPEEFANLDHTINRFIKNLIKYDKNREFEHVLINLSSTLNQPKVELTHKDGYKLILLKAKSLYYPIEFSSELIRFIKNTNDGILHIHGTACYIYDTIAPYLKNKPSIAHYRGGHFTWKSFPISFPKYFLIQPITLRFPKKLFIQNKYRLEQYNKLYRIPKEKLEYIPNAINLKDFNINENRENLRRKLNFENGEILILFVGRLEKAKGLIELINSFESLSNKYKHIKLLIAGNGSLRDFIIGKSKRNKSIIYLGHKSFEELKKIYRISDIFVLPTHYDSFPNVILEAMAFELPIISTLVEGPLTAVEDKKNGFLIKPKDKKELTEKLEILINKEELRKKMGKYGRKKIEEEFNWDILSKKIFKIYYSLI